MFSLELGYRVSWLFIIGHKKRIHASRFESHTFFFIYRLEFFAERNFERCAACNVDGCGFLSRFIAEVGKIENKERFGCTLSQVYKKTAGMKIKTPSQIVLVTIIIQSTLGTDKKKRENIN